MAKCLVTGGAGFIGAHVSRHLLDQGHETVVLDDLSGGHTDNLDPRARFVKGSVVDAALVKRLFAEERFDRVYHLAAYAAEGLSHFIKRFNYENNVAGSVNIINACVNMDVDCLVFTSSIAVYGDAEPPVTELVVPRPVDSYGIAKYTIEMELEASRRMFGLDYVIFRPHNVYGEMQNISDPYRNVLGIFMRQIIDGAPLSIFGDGEQTRAFTYIGDIAPILARAPDVPEARGRVFNIGADIPHSVNSLADVVRRAMGAPEHPIRHLDARDEVKHAWSDHSNVRTVFGAAAVTDLENGVRRMADWAKEAGLRPRAVFEDIEILRGLPESWRNLPGGPASRRE